MFKQSLRPLARARPATTARLARSPLQVRFNSSTPNPSSSSSGSSSSSTTGTTKSAGNLVIPGSIVVIALAMGAYFYVPVTQDVQQAHHAKSEGGPNIGAKLLDGVKILEPEKDVRKSVLDQDSLHVPIHSKAVKESVKAQAKETSDPVPETVEKKAEEAQQPNQSAFNEETGEINWDCPCLGGMADGPCGEEFKAAFSCFVYSDKEPKGVECVDKFKHMQDCFREHPDVYGEEIDDDDEEPVDGPTSVKSRPDSQQTPPALPKKEPPQNSEILATTPETTPSKGVSKLVPTEKRGDKAPGGISPPVGEGTVPKPYTGKDSP